MRRFLTSKVICEKYVKYIPFGGLTLFTGSCLHEVAQPEMTRDEKAG